MSRSERTFAFGPQPCGLLFRSPQGSPALVARPNAPGRRWRQLRARSGETLGIVGESGSGKSTLARALIGTVPSTGGQALWQGEDLLAMGPKARHRHRRDIQMIFQDPLAALDPRMSAGEIIAESLVTHEPRLSRVEAGSRVAAMLERVGLRPEHAKRYPHEFSGGQCQRISIAARSSCSRAS